MGEFWKLRHRTSESRPWLSARSFEARFADAVKNGALSLAYQPFFDVLTGEGRGAEALARWKLASGGSVAPSVFIPLAERTGKIHAMGAWALKAACEAAHGWCSGSARRLTLSVNVSALQVNSEFISVISECLNSSSLPAAQLELEITETALLRNMALSIECLTEWKKIGVQIALDDFGTGYSSLDYLCRLPIDRLKVDQSLVRHLGVEKKCAIVLRSIITLGSDLGIDVIAEGVETELQLQMLSDLGCPRAQGYLLGRPMSARQAQAALEKPWGNRRAPALHSKILAAGVPRTLRAKSLNQVLGRNEGIRELVKQAAEELSSAGSNAPGVSGVLGTNQGVGKKLKVAFERLTTVSQALKVEIRERTMVDHQLAAALEQEEGSRRAALHDPLTALPNRVLFNDRLEHALAHARRHGWILAVMFLDLDQFKKINDMYGHHAGDTVLQTVATRLAQNTRIDDTVSRYGGDEFLCLLTPLSKKYDIAMIASQILMAIQAPCDMDVGDVVVSLRLEASIGISMFPQDGDTAAELIMRADDAMYRAKENKSGIVFAQENTSHDERAEPYGRANREDAVWEDAPPPIFDVQSSGDNQALQGKGRQTVRAH
jgi:diguanylate cyclase (GGDEF)-like protein